MDRSTDSRRARNSDSVTIGGRRRPVSRPSRRRCFLASSLVEPLTERTSSLPFGSRTCTTVSGGSSELSESGGPSAEPRRRLRRRRRRPLAPSASSSAVAGVAVAVCRRPQLRRAARRACRRPSRPQPCAALGLVRRLRVREDDRLARRPGRAGWPRPLGRVRLGVLGCSSPGTPAVRRPASAAASWSPVRPRPRLDRRLRRRPVPAPSSSSPDRPSRLSRGPALSAAGPGAGPAGADPPAAARAGRRRAPAGRRGLGPRRGRLEHHLRRLEHRRGHRRVRALRRRHHAPPVVLSLDSLSYSSLSSIRAISSQAPGRAVPRRSASWRSSAARPHTAREHIVNVGPAEPRWRS